MQSGRHYEHNTLVENMWTSQPLTDESVLHFLVEIRRTQHRMATIRETANHFGHQSPTSVQRIFARLQERGIIQQSGRRWSFVSEAPLRRGLRVLGRIAAGQPIEALETEDSDEVIDLGDAYDPDLHFGLIVQGDSMIEAHIVEGDIAVIRRQQTCQDGEIVAAVIEGEATLKRFFRKSGYILLKPENSRLKPIQAQEVEIRGVMVGLLRRF